MLHFLIISCSCLALTVAASDGNGSFDFPNSHRRLRRSYDRNLKWKTDYSSDFNDWDFYHSKPSRVDDPSGDFHHQAPSWTGVAFPNADQELDVTSLMTRLSGLIANDKKERQSFFGGLLSDPKSVVASAAVPLALLLFAVLPHLSSRFSSLSAVQEVVQTMASSRLGDPKLLESLAMDLAAFASRTLQEEDSCLQKATCEMLLMKNGAAKAVAQTVRRFSRESWLKTLGMTRMMTALEKRDCRYLCHRPGSKSNSRRKH